jgi:hypothetical protein
MHLTLQDAAEAGELGLILAGGKPPLAAEALEAHAQGVQGIPDLVCHPGGEVPQGRQTPVARGELLQCLDALKIAPLVEEDGDHAEDTDQEDGPGVDHHVSPILSPHSLDGRHREAKP